MTDINITIILAVYVVAVLLYAQYKSWECEADSKKRTDDLDNIKRGVKPRGLC